jgi:predicted nucleic acid-binding protein
VPFRKQAEAQARYFDTSYILKCYLNEPGAEQVRELARHSRGLASAVLGRMEFFAGVHRHHREGRLGKSDARRVLQWFAEDEGNDVWTFYPLSQAIVSSVCEHFARLRGAAPHLSGTFLRTGDAIHLATAEAQGFDTIYSGDRHLLAAAGAFSLSAVNLLS